MTTPTFLAQLHAARATLLERTVELAATSGELRDVAAALKTIGDLALAIEVLQDTAASPDGAEPEEPDDETRPAEARR